MLGESGFRWIDFDQLAMLVFCHKCPIDNVIKCCSRTDNNCQIAWCSSEISLDSFHLIWVQFFVKPNDTWPHRSLAARTFRNSSLILVQISSAEIATRTPRDEDVSVNLHDAFCWQAMALPFRACVKIVDVLGKQ